MIKLINLKCPNCYANLEVSDSVKQCFCMYCGTKILIDNSNEHIVRVIDEADLAKEENRRLELNLEMINNQKKQERKDIILAVSIFIAILLVGFIYNKFFK